MSGPYLYFQRLLGKGSFGSVSLYAGRRDDGEMVYAAVKTSDEKHAGALYREFRILSEFKGCSRIVQCYGSRVQKRLNEQGYVDYKISMEYARVGSLSNFMNHNKDRKLPDRLIRDFTRMILEGLATIHARGYVHCDLKPENILVFPSRVYKKGAWRASFELKISDFGLSRRDGDSTWWQPDKPFAGTPIYMSPESISNGETGKDLDLWSLGCIILEMYTGKRPWWHRNCQVDDLMNGHEPPIPSDLPFHAKLFIMTCFAAGSNKRKDASRLLRHIFVREDANMIPEPSVNAKIDKPREEVILAITKLVRQIKLSQTKNACVTQVMPSKTIEA